MADPQHKGKHPFHDNRWVMTEDAEIEHDNNSDEWTLARGSIICMMRDHVSSPDANAKLVAAAPELLAVLQNELEMINFLVKALSLKQTISISSLQNCAAKIQNAIRKATE